MPGPRADGGVDDGVSALAVVVEERAAVLLRGDEGQRDGSFAGFGLGE